MPRRLLSQHFCARNEEYFFRTLLWFNTIQLPDRREKGGFLTGTR
jgi:hypothetical protein